jgi:glycosyltransferase involved in cell wall biosynthesis
MRIAHVTDSYLPCVGGIEMHVHDLATRQRELGHDAVVLTAGPERVHDATPVLAFGGVFGVLAPTEYRALRRTIASQAFDVLHAHVSLVSPLAWVAVRAAVRAGVPVVVTMHSMVPGAGQLTPVLRALERGAGSGIVWTAVSEAAARPLRAALDNRPVTVLRNGIEPADWHQERTAPRGRPLTVVSVMRMSRRKRPVPLVGVLADVRRRLAPDQPLRAVVVGAGPQLGATLRAARRLGVASWVELRGALGRPEIRDLLADADLFLAPAHQESFGLAALEARCAGVPVVAMSQGGAGEFVRDGVEGFLVEDDEEMAVAAAHLLSTPEALDRMKQHNGTTQPRMTWTAVVAQNLAAYRAAGAPQVPETVPSLASL